MDYKNEFIGIDWGTDMEKCPKCGKDLWHKTIDPPIMGCIDPSCHWTNEVSETREVELEE
jgi:ssDNA-binding Zn-finger/Zn-ribbon topoisomerase 1